MQSLEDRAEDPWYMDISIPFICVRSIILTNQSVSVLCFQRYLSRLLYIHLNLAIFSRPAIVV